MRVLCLRLTSVYTVLLLTINMLCGVGELLIQNGGRDTQFTTIADLMACSRVRRRSQSVCERHQTSIRELSTSLLKGHMPKTVLNRKRLGHDTQICNGPGLTDNEEQAISKFLEFVFCFVVDDGVVVLRCLGNKPTATHMPHHHCTSKEYLLICICVYMYVYASVCMNWYIDVGIV